MSSVRAPAGTEHADTVVIGSGFGGSVAACRLAEGGQSVVLLERGRPYPPGSFARSPKEMQKAFWDPSQGLYGLFDVWRFSGFDSVISSGLGGGSLIYANVLLRKDEKWFVREEPMPGGGYERWPITRAELDPHYDSVEKMLGANPYPLRFPAYRNTPKTNAMISAAEQNDLAWQLPPLAVSFAPDALSDPALGVPITTPAYGNIHGVPRRTCRLTGECDIGCNDGAKNTLDHTYLSAARHFGADIRTHREVRGIRPLDGGGYEVTYVHHEENPRPHDTSKLPLHRITCTRVVLGAGAYGSTYLLMRNRSALPGLSQALGSRFSGNGDLLTFLLPRRGVGVAREFDGSHGPVITSAIRVDDTVDGGTGRGFYVEDGGYPGFVDWLVESSDVTGTAFRLGEGLLRWVLARVTGSAETHFSNEVSRVLSDGTLSAGSLPLLGMGRDVPDGVMRLRDGLLDVDWTTQSSEAYFARVRETMQDLARSLGAEYLDNPMWFFRKVVTVHPVGGAPMGRTENEGVCDSYGEVFNHPGLYVSDGAVMPGPVGTNPSLTIAAHADRMATHILETARVNRHAAADRSAGNSRSAGRSSTRDTAMPINASRSANPVGQNGAGPNGAGQNGAGQNGAGRSGASRNAGSRALAAAGSGPARATGPTGSARPTSLSFTEEMKGFFAFDTSDPATGERLGRERDQALMFHLTITADDAERFLSEPDHLAHAEGWIASDALGGRLPVSHATFNLFVAGDSPNSRRMNYRLFFADGAGNPLTLSGRKEVRDDSILDVWLDTSTLFYVILPGHVTEAQEPDAPVRGAGVAHIHPADFAHQLTTFRTAGPHSGEVLLRFGRFFMGQLWDVYGARPVVKPTKRRTSPIRTR